MKKIKKILNIKVLIILFIIFMPLTLFSATAISVDIPAGLVGYNAPGVNINLVIQNVINGIVTILGSITLLMFIIGGMLFMLAGGNSEKVTKAKNILEWALKGMFIILLSYFIILFIFNIVSTDSEGGTDETIGPLCPCIDLTLGPGDTGYPDNGPKCEFTSTPTQAQVQTLYGVQNCDDYSANQAEETWACRACLWEADGEQTIYKRGLCPSASAGNMVCTKIEN